MDEHSKANWRAFSFHVFFIARKFNSLENFHAEFLT